MLDEALKDQFQPGVRADCFDCGVSFTKEDGKCIICGKPWSEVSCYWTTKVQNWKDDVKKQVEAKDAKDAAKAKAGPSDAKTIDWDSKGTVNTAVNGCTPPVFTAFRDKVKPLYDAKHKDWDMVKLGNLEECCWSFMDAYNNEAVVKKGDKGNFLDANIRSCDPEEIIKNIIKILDKHAQNA